MNAVSKQAAFTIILVIIVAVLFYYVGISHYLSLSSIQAHAATLKEQAATNYLKAVFLFIVLSAALMSFALPLTGPIAICAGYLFGFWAGTLYAMIGVIAGIAISFIMIRYVLYRLVMHRYGERITSFNNRMRVYGYSYLITLQLLMVVPYFVINALAAFAHVPLHAFLWTTFAGSLPVVVIYAFAGRQLTQINAWSDILSVNMLLLLLLLAALAIVPMIMRRYQRIDPLETMPEQKTADEQHEQK